MPVPNSLSDLSKNPTQNSPQGTESAKGTIDDYLRTHAAFIAQLAALVAGATVTLASSASVAIGAAGSLNISITGTTNIYTFDNCPEGTLRWVTFTGALIISHTPNIMVLPGAANIATAAGDVALFKSLGGGNWKCMNYQPAAGYLAAAAAATYLSKAGGVMTGPLILPEGNVKQPSLTFANEGGNNTGLCHIGEDTLGIVCGGILVGQFTVNGFRSIKVEQGPLP